VLLEVEWGGGFRSVTTVKKPLLAKYSLSLPLTITLLTLLPLNSVGNSKAYIFEYFQMGKSSVPNTYDAYSDFVHE